MSFADFENRKEPRITLTYPARIDWVDEAGRKVSEEALTADISNSGACLMTKHRLEVGKRINVNLKIEGQEGSSIAIVKWAAITETGFHIGIRFERG